MSASEIGVATAARPWKGHAPPEGFRYDRNENVWVTVLEDRARIAIDEDVIELQPGDCADIHARRRHRVEWTDPDRRTVWPAVYY